MRELLLGLEAHRGAAIIEHLAPGGEHRSLHHLAAHEPERRRAHELDLGDRRLAEARHLLQALLRRIQRLGEASEVGKDGFGQRLGVAPRHRAEQDELEQLVVGKRIVAGLAEASPLPLAMAEIVWLAGVLETHSGRSIAE